MGMTRNIDIDVDITQILNQFDEVDIIEHFDEDALLKEMRYDPNMCFQSSDDLKEAVENDPGLYGLELKEYFDGMNDNDIYDRFLNLLCNNKLTYSEWDEILSRYE